MESKGIVLICVFTLMILGALLADVVTHYPECVEGASVDKVICGKNNKVEVVPQANGSVIIVCRCPTK